MSDGYTAVMIGGRADGRTYILRALPDGRPPKAMRVVSEAPHQDPTNPWTGIPMVDESYPLRGPEDRRVLTYVHESWVRCPDHWPSPVIEHVQASTCPRCGGLGWVAP